MADALGAILIATTATPADTMVADFRRAIRLVLRLKRTILTIGRGSGRRRGLDTSGSLSCHIPSATDEPISSHLMKK
ncbi:hypothetical protein JCM4814A_90460 [Streptomyces phaeofaciens JCM 4814]|uniref:Uncharacterized protein n=1 Tax=Streptomyces phaeofaciens TaxID=68254 RepID=A0A918HC47_9ACTN|nr:hypothetical protein GCM10010226_31070 [Streptomyces phaeofaciens]